ncbi:unnamed protein product [Darwinula stevensoni]|uniref:G-protein coupled receptors family 1 profile domain-containing protein n=1 Tax=Darwinula stevensoni TaxID=69355 RepID=A0A7R8X557_9CRUS|nr:unnamed protein product [Darwinula stevensoni]CAG0886299.1 unnamed protein product [Darwinula stevensoni]
MVSVAAASSDSIAGSKAADRGYAPSLNALRRVALRKRTEIPALPPTVADLQVDGSYRCTMEGVDWLIHDHLYNALRMMIFATPKNLEYLQHATTWYGDGTFGIAPRARDDVEDVQKVLAELETTMPSEAKPVGQYFRETYVDGRRRRGRARDEVVYPPQLWNVRDRTLSRNRSHVISASICCCLIPGGIMVYCYVTLIFSIKTASKCIQNARVLKKAASRERSLTKVVATLCLSYWVAWLPYTCVSLITAFGGKSSLDPMATVIPVMMAKSSFAINPILYAYMRLWIKKDWVQDEKTGD